MIALKICASLTVYAQIEEEIFYPQVRTALSPNEAPIMKHADIELRSRLSAAPPTRPSVSIRSPVLVAIVGRIRFSQPRSTRRCAFQDRADPAL